MFNERDLSICWIRTKHLTNVIPRWYERNARQLIQRRRCFPRVSQDEKLIYTTIKYAIALLVFLLFFVFLNSSSHHDVTWECCAGANKNVYILCFSFLLPSRAQQQPIGFKKKSKTCQIYFEIWNFRVFSLAAYNFFAGPVLRPTLTHWTRNFVNKYFDSA